MKGPGPVATDITAHLYADGLTVSPNDAPIHTSNGDSIAWPWNESIRLNTATYPTAVCAGRRTDAQLFSPCSVMHMVDTLPSMMADAGCCVEYVELNWASRRRMSHGRSESGGTGGGGGGDSKDRGAGGGNDDGGGGLCMGGGGGGGYGEDGDGVPQTGVTSTQLTGHDLTRRAMRAGVSTGG